MKIFAENEGMLVVDLAKYMFRLNPVANRAECSAVVARSRFWYFLRKLRKVKKSAGEILSTNEIFEAKPDKVKNIAIWLRYNSRSATINMCKEFRDVTFNGAVQQMYMEMAGRHRAVPSGLQILKIQEVEAKDCKRPSITQFHDSSIKFPLAHRRQRAPSKRVRSTFVANRPSTCFN
jgi:large subunit ribosomal protein L18Ae